MRKRMTKIIDISSGKGGVGKTIVTSNLALALKSFGKHVTMIDCNLSTPHLSYYLGVDGYNATLNDALLGKARIEDAVYNYDGVKYIPASLDLKDLVGIELTNFKRIISRLAKSGKSDFILLDSAPGLGREAVSAMNVADEVIFVTTPFISAVNDVIRCADVLREFQSKSMGIVLNMVTGKKHELLSKTVEEASGIKVIGEIPFDNSIVQSLVFGSPVLDYRPESPSSIGFMKLAAGVANVEYAPPSRMEQLFSRVRNFLFNGGLRAQQGREVEGELVKGSL
jgi:cell division ATPase MinD